MKQLVYCIALITWLICSPSVSTGLADGGSKMTAAEVNKLKFLAEGPTSKKQSEGLLKSLEGIWRQESYSDEKKRWEDMGREFRFSRVSANRFYLEIGPPIDGPRATEYSLSVLYWVGSTRAMMMRSLGEILRPHFPAKSTDYFLYSPMKRPGLFIWYNTHGASEVWEYSRLATVESFTYRRMDLSEDRTLNVNDGQIWRFVRTIKKIKKANP